MKIDGACHCGAVAYEADVDPARVHICHCTDCQKLSGSAFSVVVRVEESFFHILRGQPKIYFKTANSGTRRAQAFCADCGSRLYATSVGEAPKILGLRIGAISQRDKLIPRRQFWRRSKPDWVDSVTGLPLTERS